MSIKICAIIPVYNHCSHLEEIARSLVQNGLMCIFVDDGSNEETKAVLRRIAAQSSHVTHLILPRNQGKGAAVVVGMKHAIAQGYTHALQVDADGQHDLKDVTELIKLAKGHPDLLVSGIPLFDHTVPLVRFYGRYLTHVLVWVETLSLRLRDSMCGFRIYPLVPTYRLVQHTKMGSRMEFDTEIMVRLYWSGVETVFLPTHVHYPVDGISHFRLFRDNVRMVWMHVRLLAAALLRSPMLFRRMLRRKNMKHWTQMQERGTVLGIRIFDAVYRCLGRRACYMLLAPVTTYYFLTAPLARRSSRQFLTAVMSYTGKNGSHNVRPTIHNSFRHFWQFAKANMDMLIAWRNPEQIAIRFPRYDFLISEVAQKKGALFISAHIGNLEMARALSTKVPGLKINALVYTKNAIKSSVVLEEVNVSYNLRIIHVQEIKPDTAMMLRSKIAAGEIVVTVGDRTPVDAASPVVQANFLGRPAPFAVGPYVLAHLLECPVYLFFCLEQADGYLIHLEPFAERIQLPRRGRGRDAVLRELAACYAGKLEDYAVRFPLQWYNFYDFWDHCRTTEAWSHRRRTRKTDPHDRHAHSFS